MPIMNLWAEFENEQQLAESAGRAQKQKSSQGRRLTEQMVLSSLRDWLLHDYVASYCRSLAATRIYRRCYWIDGLGAGMLQPVAALAEELAKENRPIGLHSIVLGAGSSKGKGGRAADDENAGRRSGFSLPKEGGLVRASWLEIASRLLEFIDQSPAIFLLNPFGNTLFTYDDLAPLYTRTAPTELCLLVSHKQVETRVIPSLRTSVSVATLALDRSQVKGEVANLTSPTGDQKGNKAASSPTQPPSPLRTGEQGDDSWISGEGTKATPPAGDQKGPSHRSQPPSPLQTTEQVDVESTPMGASHSVPPLTALLRSDRWKRLVSKEEEVGQIIDGIIDLLIASMQRHFLAVQRVAIPVQVGPAVVETAPYTLIFATRRQDSLASMNDAVCLYRRRLYEQSLRGVLIEDWFARQQQERLNEEMQQLYARTLQQGRSQGVRRWPELRQQLLLANFGQFTLHDYDEVIRKLLLSGEVRCEWRQRPALAGNVEDRIPGNDDTLLWKQM